MMMKLICTLLLLFPLCSYAQYQPLLVGNSDTGSGAKLFFNADVENTAFRAGYVFNNAWDPPNLGANSAGFGLNTIASGENSFASGFDAWATGRSSCAFNDATTAAGNESFASGDGSFAQGDHSFVTGLSTEAFGTGSFAANRETNAHGFYSGAFGVINSAHSYGEFVVGTYATNYDEVSEVAFHSGDRAFVVGNGTSNGSRSNAFTIWKDGNIGIGTSVNPSIENSISFGGEGILVNPNEFEFDFIGNVSTKEHTTLGYVFDLGTSMDEGYWDDLFVEDVVYISDMRAKSNVEELEYGIEEIMNMRTIKYTLNSDPMAEFKIGFSAQNLVELIPEAVKTEDLKYNPKTEQWETVQLELMGVKYINIIPVLVNAMKDQQSIIETQNELIATQQIEFDEMKNRLREIESMLKK